jgi:hypothetical protein
MRLADFIRQNEAAIITEWIEFARTRSPASDSMSKLALQDHTLDILKFVARDLESATDSGEQFDKSRGLADRDGPFRQTAAEIQRLTQRIETFSRHAPPTSSAPYSPRERVYSPEDFAVMPAAL